VLSNLKYSENQNSTTFSPESFRNSYTIECHGLIVQTLKIFDSIKLSEKSELIKKQIEIVKEQVKLLQTKEVAKISNDHQKEVAMAQNLLDSTLLSPLSEPESKKEEIPSLKILSEDELNVKKLDDQVKRDILKEILESKNVVNDINSGIENLKKEIDRLSKDGAKKSAKMFETTTINADTEHDIFKDIFKTYVANKDRKDKEMLKELLKKSSNHLISANAILYSCLSRKEKLENLPMDLPIQRDSINIIYTIIKMMESAGFNGNINSRPLDTGSGLTGNVLMNANSDYFKNLLDESIGSKNNPFFDCYPSMGFELGPMDSLLSYQ
jgi:hypothetical protein